MRRPYAAPRVIHPSAQEAADFLASDDGRPLLAILEASVRERMSKTVRWSRPICICQGLPPPAPCPGCDGQRGSFHGGGDARLDD